MNHKQKQFLFFLSLLLFLTSANFAFALNAIYPQFPGLPVITDDSTVPQLIQYFFGVGIAFGGVMALISLAIAGVQMIIGQANPEGVSGAKDRIKGSLLGLVLLMVSFLIIQSINPALTSPTMTALSDEPGVFYSGSSKQTNAPAAEIDTSSISSDFTEIKYRCQNNTGPKLLIWAYPQTNFGDYKNATTMELSCGDSKSIADLNKSFKIAYKSPGVYLCLYGCSGNTCNGYRSDDILSSGSFPEEFKNLTNAGIEFVNDPTTKTFYGAILHENLNQGSGGNCQAPLLSTAPNADECKPVKIQANSMTILNMNANQIDSGNGLDFYSEPYGWDTKGADSGIYRVPSNAFVGSPMIGGNPATFPFDYTGVDQPQAYQNKCKTFKDCPGSIRIKGSYTVALYSAVGDGYCQNFQQDVVDMEGTEYIGPGTNELRVIYAIPTK